jgi:thiamine biosynthesis lipoprotein ApbE
MNIPIPDAIGSINTAQREFSAIGTRVTVATTFQDSVDIAELMLRWELAKLDRACSRFRTDSEISQAHQRGGDPVLVSQLLSDVVDAALMIANDTNGAVDPTIGAAINVLGYDRDFDEIAYANGSLLERPRVQRRAGGESSSTVPSDSFESQME